MLDFFLGLLFIAFSKEFIIINQELIIYLTFLIITLLFIFQFKFLSEVFINLKENEKSQLKVSSVNISKQYNLIVLKTILFSELLNYSTIQLAELTNIDE